MAQEDEYFYRDFCSQNLVWQCRFLRTGSQKNVLKGTVVIERPLYELLTKTKQCLLAINFDVALLDQSKLSMLKELRHGLGIFKSLA